MPNPRANKAPARELGLLRSLRRIDRLDARGRRLSGRFTSWRFAVFAVGLLASIIIHKMGWTQLGNGALASFVLLSILAWHHNKLEDRLHTAPLAGFSKEAHVARIRLHWEEFRTARPLCPNDMAGCQDPGPRRPLFICYTDDTISSQGQERLTSWLFDQPPQSSQWSATEASVSVSTPPLLRDRLSLEAQAVEEARYRRPPFAGTVAEALDNSSLVPDARDRNPARDPHCRTPGRRSICGESEYYWMSSFLDFMPFCFSPAVGPRNLRSCPVLTSATGASQRRPRLSRTACDRCPCICRSTLAARFWKTPGHLPH